MYYMACALLVAGVLPAAARPAADDPDALYARRGESLADAEKAASAWEQALAADPANFDAARKLARACYWLGGHRKTEDEREATAHERMIARTGRGSESDARIAKLSNPVQREPPSSRQTRCSRVRVVS